LRNSFRYAARQDWDKLAKALRPVYTAPSAEAAEERSWSSPRSGERNKYPAIVKLWSDAWAEFVPFLAYDVEIRKVIRSAIKLTLPRMPLQATSAFAVNPLW
jgi:transposase-like protein